MGEHGNFLIHHVLRFLQISFDLTFLLSRDHFVSYFAPGARISVFQSPCGVVTCSSAPQKTANYALHVKNEMKVLSNVFHAMKIEIARRDNKASLLE